MSHLTSHVIDSLGKDDLINQCDALGIDSTGTVESLRNRLRECVHLSNSDNANKLNDDDSGKTKSDESKPSETIPTGMSPELLFLMNWMNQQNDKRFEQYLNIQREQMGMFMSEMSDKGAGQDSDLVNSYAVVKSSVDRLQSEADIVMHAVRANIANKKSKEETQSSIVRLCRLEQRLEKVLDKKIDCLDDDADKHDLLSMIYNLQERMQQVKVRADVYLIELEKIEKAKANSGPLPQNVEIPVFDGNPINFPTWWDHFKSLVHDNASVSDFWKMRYLLKAVTGSASPILAGKLGLAEEYEDSIKAVQDKYGSESIIVRHLVNSIMSHAQPSLKDLPNFGKFIEIMKTSLVSLERYKATKDMIILPILEGKLPPSMRKSWERKVCAMLENKDVPSSNALIKFCEAEFEALNSVSSKALDVKPTSTSSRRENLKSKHSLSKNVEFTRPFSAQSLVAGTIALSSNQEKLKRKDITCLCCDQHHGTKECPVFCNMIDQDRRKVITDHKHCFKCLDVKFRFNHKCGYKKCPKCSTAHHELLSCPESSGASQSQTQSRENPEVTKGLLTISNEGEEILPTVQARAVSGNKSEIIRLALDTMSQKTFITERMAKLLSLQPLGNKTIAVHGFGGNVVKETVSSVRVDLFALDGQEHISVEAYVKKGRICSPMQAIQVDIDQWPHLRDLNLSDPNVPENAEIDMLIGQAPFQHIVKGDVVKPQAQSRSMQPSAWNTIFGYAIMGPVSSRSDQKSSSLTASICQLDQSVRVEDTESTENPNLERFWSVDILGITDKEEHLSQEDQQAWKVLKDEIEYDGERYVVPLIFKKNSPILSDNFGQAKRQLESTEARLLKSPTLQMRYTEAINEYERRGYARKLTEAECIEFSNGENYFVPHHAVIRESSVATKVRIVFNASSPDPNGNSLNSCLLPGPALQTDIGGVLLRFRTHRVVLTGDIEKMFLQTRIKPEHFQYQQYLWRDCDQSKEPQRYVMTRVMFGVTCSPFLAMASIQEHATTDEMRESCPNACKLVQNSLYVDDLLIGEDTESQVAKLYHEISEFFEKGGWHLTKFASNSQTVLETILEKDRHPSTVIDLTDKDSGSMSTLGLKWNTNSDLMHVNAQAKQTFIPDLLTKRVILSIISSIYDLFGFLSPYVIRGKILMQEIWKLQIGWDEAVPLNIKNSFLKWYDEFKQIADVSIPRFLFSNRANRPNEIDLHGFCDASEKAYGALVYLTFRNENSERQSSLIISKARVSPLKSQSIARLELMGALILARLIDYVVKAIGVPVHDIHLWTDSEIVIAWLRKPCYTWKVFVRNRVEQIQSLVKTEYWAHCPGIENPADIISRGTSIERLKQSELFWHGPEWMCQAKDQWPQQTQKHNEDTTEEVSKEEAKVVAYVSQCQEESVINDLINHSSSLNHVRRVIAWILRWRNKRQSTTTMRTRSRSRHTTEVQELTASELDQAEKVLIRQIQGHHFAKEVNNLTDKRIEKNSRLCSFDPYLDEHSILRVGGRLQHSHLPYNARHPIILPDRCRFSELLVKSIHENGDHASIEGTLSLLRQRYHIIHSRQTVKRVLKNCLVCQKFNTVPKQQKMGNLPKHRVVPAPAFSEVGLDFTGALQIRDGEEIQKCYICVFTCPHSRMVHFELTRNMTT